MMGAAVATLVAYVVLFVGDVAEQPPRLPRRVPVAARDDAGGGRGGADGRSACAVGSLPLAIALILAYPLVLLPLGFYQPAELARLRRLVPG